MTRPLSTDLREHLVSAVEGGQSRRSAAKAFGVSAAAATCWFVEWQRSGSFARKPQGGDSRSHRIGTYAQENLALIEEGPDITLTEIAAHPGERCGLEVAQSAAWRLLGRRGPTFETSKHRRAGAARQSAPQSGPVRRAARSAPRAAGFHRPDRCIDRDGAALRPGDLCGPLLTRETRSRTAFGNAPSR